MTWYVHESGVVEHRPTPVEQHQADRNGVSLITTGRLCTACLSGSWPLSMQRSAQYVCDSCGHLDAVAAHLRAVPSVVTRHDSRRPAALAYRSVRLRDAFDAATDLGLSVETHHGDRVIRRTDLAAVLPDDAEARVRRFAAWVRAIAPEEAAVREEALSDVGLLAWELRTREGRVRSNAARSDLDRALRDARRLPGRLASAIRGRSVRTVAGRTSTVTGSKLARVPSEAVGLAPPPAFGYGGELLQRRKDLDALLPGHRDCRFACSMGALEETRGTARA